MAKRCGWQNGKVGDEVRTRGDEDIGRKDEGELVGATNGNGKQRQQRWSCCGGRTRERERGRLLYSREVLERA
jgi:hypothetical protein